MVSSAVLQHSRSAATTVVGQVDAAALRVVCEAVEHLLEIGERRWEVTCRGVVNGIAR
jgi:hypothetical protein